MKKLPKCRFFRDVTWTFINCPKNSVAYIIKRQAYQSEQGVGYQYSFACSPQSVRIILFYLLKMKWRNINLEDIYRRGCGAGGKSRAGCLRPRREQTWRRSTPIRCASARTDTSAPGGTRTSASSREKSTPRTWSAPTRLIASKLYINKL